jgi:hypothetical protein
VAAVFRGENAARAEVKAPSERLNVTNEAMVTFPRIPGKNQVPLEKLPETLGDHAQRHVEMLDRLAALAPEDPEIQVKVEVARAAADRRRLNAAAARAERGEIALTQLDYLRAAGHFEQASKLVSPDKGQLSGVIGPANRPSCN